MFPPDRHVPVQLKIRQQLQHLSAGQKGYMGPLQLLRRLGLSGMYHGTSITLVRDVPSFGAYFLAYKVQFCCVCRSQHMYVRGEVDTLPGVKHK